MNDWIARNLIYFPIQMLRGEWVWQHLPLMREMEKLSSREIEKFQWSKAKELINYCYENVPFYKKRFTSIGLIPKDIKDKSDLLKIPVLTKDEIRNHWPEMIPKNGYQRLTYRSTSGTSGTPLIFPKDHYATSYMDAAMYQVYSWYGIKIGDRQARLWGSATKPVAQIKQKFKDYLLNRVRLSAFNMTDENCYNYYKKLLSFRPKFIYGYPNAILSFSKFLRRNKIDGTKLTLKAVICTGEILFPEHRKIIESTFKSKVVNEYGTTENGIIAFECPEGNMHILAHNVLVEFIKDGHYVEPGESGQIVVTELNSRCIPFLRYKLDDIGKPSDKKCTCGRNLPLMEIIEGRIDDFIQTPDGRLVYDAILAYLFKEGVKEFRGIQKAKDELIIQLVKDAKYNTELENHFRNELVSYLGRDMHIHFQYLKEIPRDKSGKLQYFVSLIH